ncbi:MAG TPA: PIN domain-containing protein [Terracidiphilus sp.]|jgi:predicted nucleic acid-binding protein|nr:PIN domain-containing protein [Terracidiphilus sp.]
MGLVKFSSQSLPILVDTSFLVSVYDKRERFHLPCMAALARVRRPLATCEAVVTESIYHLQGIPGAPQALLASIETGQLGIPFRLAGCAGQVHAHFAKYADTPCDFADACLIQMADELDTGEILTLDSDFEHYRWRRNRRFRLLVPLE